MKLYVTPAGTWAGTQADAKVIARDEHSSFEAVEVPTDKAGLLRFLNEQCVIIGEPVTAAHVGVPEAAERQPGYAEFSVNLDEQFDKLSLAHQLHFASLAMERARESVQ